MLKRFKKELNEGKTLIQFGFLKSLGLSLAMLMPLILAKFFSKELFASYSLAKMIIFFFTTITIGSARTPFIVFANQERTSKGKINKTFSVQCIFVFSCAILFFLLCLLFDQQILKFTRINRTELIYINLGFIGLIIKSYVCNLFMALGKRIQNSLTEFVFGISACVLVFIFHITGKLTLSNGFLTYFIAGLISSLLLIKNLDTKQISPFALSLEHTGKMLNFIKWMMLGTTVVYFINWGDNLVLRYYFQDEAIGEIGTYNLAYQIFKGFVMLSSVVLTYFLPFVSEYINDKDKIKQYLYVKRIKIIVLATAFISMVFFIGPWCLGLIYGNKFEGAAGVLRVLLIGIVFILWSDFYGPVFHALKWYRITKLIALIHVSINIILDIVLVPSMGIMGAAVATTTAYLCRLIMMESLFQIKLKKSFM